MKMTKEKIMKRIPIDILKKDVMDKYLKSGAVHLIITGSIGIGKTTLLNEILKDFESVSGVRSRLDIKDGETGSRDIVLSEIGCDVIYRVAGWNGEKMEVIDDFFDKTGSQILEKHLINDSEIFVMDEVGPLEEKSERFMELLSKIFEVKKVFAIMKKRASALKPILEARADYFIIDIDDYYDKIPYEELIKKRISGKFD